MLSYSTIAITSILGIVVTPFMIRMLGDSEYGLFVLMGSYVGYITLLDLGLNHTIIRYVSKYRVEKDKKGEERFLATVMLIYIVIAFLVVAAGAVVYAYSDPIFQKSLTVEELEKIKIITLILTFNMAIALPGGAFAAICNGYEHFVFPRAMNIIRYIIRSAMLVGILWLGGKAISVVVLDTVANIVAISVNAYYVLHRINVKIRFQNIDLSLIRTIFSYSVWLFVFSIIAQFQWQTGQLVLGIFSGTKYVAIYGVGIMLGTYYGGFGSAISELFLAKATRMVVDGSTAEDLTTMMIKIGRVSMLVLLYIMGGFFLYGKSFIHLWVGDGYYDSWFIALLIMVGYTIPLVQSFSNSILVARALLAFKALVFLGMTIAGTVCGAFLLRDFGVRGMIAGSVAFWMLAQVVMNFYYRRVLKLNVFRFFKELSDKIVISFLMVLVICSLVLYHPEASWGHFLFNTVVYSLVYAAFMFIYGMNIFEKSIFLDYLKRYKKKDAIVVDN